MSKEDEFDEMFKLMKPAMNNAAKNLQKAVEEEVLKSHIKYATKTPDKSIFTARLWSNHLLKALQVFINRKEK